VPLVLVPVVAAITSAVRGDAEQARIHAGRRAAAWLSERTEVDPTAHVALAFNRALIEALLGNPAGVLEELEDVELTDASGFISQQVATCEVLMGWARACLGRPDGVELAEAGIAVIAEGSERVLQTALRTFFGEALIETGDPAAVEQLAQAQREGEQRGEVWWMAETLRLRALADHRFGDGRAAAALLDEAEALAERQGALLILPRIAETRRSLV
jgi:hypothetical protein